MGIMDFFETFTHWTPEKVKEFLKGKDPDSYNLIDVRQPKEFEEMHLPGAKLIPLAQLPERIKEIDPRKPTIVY